VNQFCPVRWFAPITLQFLFQLSKNYAEVALATTKRAEPFKSETLDTSNFDHLSQAYFADSRTFLVVSSFSFISTDETMSTQTSNHFESYLKKFGEAEWQDVIKSLLPAIHEVDR